MLHGHLWGGWQYQMSGANLHNASFFLGYGGYQEARGSHIGTNKFYVENVFEELDTPGEWYYDEQEQLLFVYFNQSDSPQSAQVSVAVLESLIHIEGNTSAATNIVLQGLTLTETKSTFMQQYEVCARRCSGIEGQAPTGWSRFPLVETGACIEMEPCLSTTLSTL